jgi:hypothetical protein
VWSTCRRWAEEPLAPRVLVVGHFAQDDLSGNAFAREEVRELLEQLHVVRTAVEVQDLDHLSGWFLSPLDAGHRVPRVDVSAA